MTTPRIAMIIKKRCSFCYKPSACVTRIVPEGYDVGICLACTTSAVRQFMERYHVCAQQECITGSPEFSTDLARVQAHRKAGRMYPLSYVHVNVVRDE